MDIKNKIEEILLTEYQYIDCYTVDKLLDLFDVSEQSELLLSAICQFTKRNKQKEIQEVEKWIETDFRK